MNPDTLRHCETGLNFLHYDFLTVTTETEPVLTVSNF